MRTIGQTILEPPVQRSIGQIDVQIDVQTDVQTDRQIDRQTDRRKDTTSHLAWEEWAIRYHIRPAVRTYIE